MLKINVLERLHLYSNQSIQAILHDTIELAQHLEKKGFYRLWITEHHFSPDAIGVSPEVVLSVLSQHTHHIRLGVGGLLLNLYPNFKLAEVYGLISHLLPDRLDLGIARGHGGPPHLVAQLSTPSDLSFTDRVDQLHLMLKLAQQNVQEAYEDVASRGFMEFHTMVPFQHMPELWMLSSSTAGFRQAEDFAFPICYGAFLNPHGWEELCQDLETRPAQVPVALAIYAFAAHTREDAARLIFGEQAPAMLSKNPQAFLTEHFGWTAEKAHHHLKRFEGLIWGDHLEVQKTIEKQLSLYPVSELFIQVPGVPLGPKKQFLDWCLIHLASGSEAEKFPV